MSKPLSWYYQPTITECDSCGSRITQDEWEESHEDDSGIYHDLCWAADIAIAAQQAMAYERKSESEIFSDARQSSIERYGFAI